MNIKTVKQLLAELSKERYDLKNAEVMVEDHGHGEFYNIDRIAYNPDNNKVFIEVNTIDSNGLLVNENDPLCTCGEYKSDHQLDTVGDLVCTVPACPCAGFTAVMTDTTEQWCVAIGQEKAEWDEEKHPDVHKALNSVLSRMGICDETP
jgi:hypothetical protein